MKSAAKLARITAICVCICFPHPAVTALPPPSGSVFTGIDVLEAQSFAPLAGKRIGLITNQTGIDRDRRSTIDLLAHAPGVKLVALFSPEHGIRGDGFAATMNRRRVPGMRFVLERFTPDFGLYKGELCQGARLVVTDRASPPPMLLGIEIASVLVKFYPDHFDVAKTIALVGNAATIRRLQDGDSPSAIASSWNAGLDALRKIRAKYLLYR